jgi:hypothetical protein
MVAGLTLGIVALHFGLSCWRWYADRQGDRALHLAIKHPVHLHGPVK